MPGHASCLVDWQDEYEARYMESLRNIVLYRAGATLLMGVEGRKLHHQISDVGEDNE